VGILADARKAEEDRERGRVQIAAAAHEWAKQGASPNRLPTALEAWLKLHPNG